MMLNLSCHKASASFLMTKVGKNGLVTRRYELVKEIGFYNQLYCGCLYSKDEAQGYLKKQDDTTIHFKPVRKVSADNGQ